MVNKGSFFQRLKDRWGSSRVRVEGKSAANHPVHTSRPNGATAAAAAVPPTPRAEPMREVATGAPAEVRSTRKMSEREEALLALNTQFQELTSLLRSSHARTDDQLGKIVSATGALAALPALSQQQLETLRALSTHMEKQSVLGEQVASAMTQLPALLGNVEKALARAAATDERTAATVREFQSNMDRIHQAMGQMVEQNKEQVSATHKLAERKDEALLDIRSGIEASQQKVMTELQRTTDESLKSLRRTHEDQSNRLQKVVQEHASWNRAVLLGLGLVVIGIGALIVLQLVK